MKNEVLFQGFLYWNHMGTSYLWYFCICRIFIWVRVSLCNPGYPRTAFLHQAGIKLQDLPVSVSLVLRIKESATMLGFIFDVYTISFLFFSLLMPNTWNNLMGGQISSAHSLLWQKRPSSTGVYIILWTLETTIVYIVRRNQ